MKKFLFAVQVFGIIAMFPIYVILEMNHGTGSLPENKSQPVVKGIIEKTAIRTSFNSEVRDGNPIRLTYLWIQYLPFIAIGQ
ncbi:MAG: hypothetical protein ABI675_29885 [Chitinophagaceae bacterium]